MVKKPTDQMPFLDHLEELRIRLFWIGGTLLVGMMVSFYLVTKFGIVLRLQDPILASLPPGQKLVVGRPLEGFMVYIKVSLIGGVVLALPMIGYHVWAFLAPGLYAHEKKLMIPVVLGATVLFIAGVALAYFVILPITLTFLIDFAEQSFTPLITAGDYFGFLITMALALGAAFELPIAIVGLTALGLVTPEMLVRFRRYAFVACLVGSAFITPGADPFSMLILTGPLYGLYELSVVLSRFVRRRDRTPSIGADPE